MPETSESYLKKPDITDGVPAQGSFQDSFTNRLLTATRDPQSEKLRKTLYKDIFHPNYSETRPLTQQSERNRQILLHALDEGISVPTKYITTDGYMNLETTRLLQELFSPDQIQRFQGVLIFNGLALSNRGMDPDNTLAVGGITYTQQAITEMGGISGLIVKKLAVPGKFDEKSLKPFFMRPNRRGIMHITPYGQVKKTPGKENEALLMISDDILTFIKLIKEPNKQLYLVSLWVQPTNKWQ